MKKITAAALTAALIVSVGSCGGKNEKTPAESSTTQSAETVESTSGSSTSEPAETSTSADETTVSTSQSEAPEPVVKHTGGMSEYERAYVTRRAFTLLDEQLPDPVIRIGNMVVTKDVIIEKNKIWLERGVLTEEEYNDEISEAEEYSYRSADINGMLYYLFIPEDGYDGGFLDVGDGVTHNNKDEIIKAISDSFADYMYDEAHLKDIEAQAEAVIDSVINKTYIGMPDRYEHAERHYYTDMAFADRRSSWEFDRDKLADIKDKTEEYCFYDDELDLEFLVYVTLPPNYDENKTYPVFFMTDAVWRLNDHAAMYKAMENGEACEVILASLGYSYNINGTSDQFRSELFIGNREALLNFITDDLMPYLGENYKINYADSTLFGHSMGGVFSHYALFRSDCYENQPFGKYIIGSPAFFNLYGAHENYDAAGAESDYGYFDRNTSLEKTVFLCGGSLEDPDYAGAYSGHDSLLTGLKKLNERVSAHEGDVTYKLYESHHYQYVPGMLLEYLKKEYPAG